MRDKLGSMLGIAVRAGRTVSGSSQTEEAVRAGRAKLVIFAADAKSGTSQRLLDKCGRSGVPVIIYGDKDTLGRIAGREERSCIAVTDAGLAARIRELAEELGKERGTNGEDEDQ